MKTRELEDEHGDRPDCAGLNAGQGAKTLVLAPAEHETGCDGREHAGDMQMIAQNVGGPGRQKPGDNVEARLLEASEQLYCDPTECDAEQDAADGEDAELQCGGPDAESARDARCDCKTEQHQSRGVIDQALTLQQRDKAWRQRQSLQHGLGRDRVGRRDDGAERETRSPGQARNQQMSHDAHNQGREADRSDRQLDDDPEIGPEVAPHGEIRARKEQGRQEKHEDQVRIEP